MVWLHIVCHQSLQNQLNSTIMQLDSIKVTVCLAPETHSKSFQHYGVEMWNYLSASLKTVSQLMLSKRDTKKV